MSKLMIGPAIDGTNRQELREIHDRDYNAYLRAGLLDIADMVYHDWIDGIGWRYSIKDWSRFEEARLAAPTTGAVDGENTVFVFESTITAVCRNNYIVSNLSGTIADDTITFVSPPQEGDVIRALVGVVPL